MSSYCRSAFTNAIIASPNDVVYFDHGAYLITSTVKVPKDIKITGEIWPLIMAGGSTSFKDQANPAPVFQVGQPGDTGSVEMSDLIFETAGPQPGAIMIEWNVAETSQGSAGMWDVHVRVGGSAGTDLQSNTCSKDPTVTAPANPACEGAFLLLHVTSEATIYLENNWFWVADHELDLSDHNQINIFNGRGVLVASEQGPVWMWGTSSEHSVLYNYQLANASNVYMGLIQTETPYYQSNPDATGPFTSNAAYSDPDFSTCSTSGCKKSWGLRVVNSNDVFVYGAGLYSFFDNYDQTCLATESCQENIVSLENSNIQLFGLSTKASTNMVTVNGKSAALDSDNRNNFCATIALFSETGETQNALPAPPSGSSSSTSSKSSTATRASSSSAATPIASLSVSLSAAVAPSPASTSNVPKAAPSSPSAAAPPPAAAKSSSAVAPAAAAGTSPAAAQPPAAAASSPGAAQPTVAAAPSAAAPPRAAASSPVASLPAAAVASAAPAAPAAASPVATVTVTVEAPCSASSTA